MIDQIGLRLELELHGELHLPGRSRVTGSESGIADHAKAGAADLGRAAGLAKVRVIEQVENLPAKFNQATFTQLQSLDHRDVGIVEGWPNHHVTTHAAEMIDGLATQECYRQKNCRASRAGASGPWITDVG